METLIIFVGAVILMVVCMKIADYRARKAEESTVYMVRPKKDNQ